MTTLRFGEVQLVEQMAALGEIADLDRLLPHYRRLVEQAAAELDEYFDSMEHMEHEEAA